MQNKRNTPQLDPTARKAQQNGKKNGANDFFDDVDDVHDDDDDDDDNQEVQLWAQISRARSKNL
jgi:hypothetical protein